MYKVMIVDDEDIIREGIISMIDWNSYPLELFATATDGLDAWEKISESTPDIIITDIKMPEMDGLGLIKKTLQSYPDIVFIVFSGYDEFEFAHQAMKYGVKHYLLKPSSDEQLAEVLEEVISDLNEKNNRKSLNHTMLSKLSNQVFRQFLTGGEYGKHEWEYYRKLFHLDNNRLTGYMVLFELEEPTEQFHLFALMNISEEILDAANIYLQTTIQNKFLVLMKKLDEIELGHKMHIITNKFNDYYQLRVTVVMDGFRNIEQLPTIYNKLQMFLKRNYYYAKGKIISNQDLLVNQYMDNQELAYDFNQMDTILPQGDAKKAEKAINDFFQILTRNRYEKNQVKVYILKLLNVLLSHTTTENNNDYMNKMIVIFETDTLEAIKNEILRITFDLVRAYQKKNTMKYSHVVNRIIEEVERHVDNPDLSLKWLAGEVLYMNKDYIGKQFKKETSHTFTDYIMNYRMEKAKEMIGKAGEFGVTQVAEMLGFRNNPAYFSRAFKKYTGMTPKGYQKKLQQ